MSASTALDAIQDVPEAEHARCDQVEAVGAMRQRRDEPQCRAALAQLTTAASGADNLVPHVLAAVEARATLGEISDALRSVFGEHRELHV